MGLGPRTGRGAGYCSGFPVPGFMNPYVPGFGRGRGFGFGRGFWRFGRQDYPFYYSRYSAPPIQPATVPNYGTPRPEDEKAYIQDAITYLEKELKALKNRLVQLEKKK